MADVHRKDEGIIRESPDLADIRAKYLEREKEAEKKAFAKRDATTPEEAIANAGKAVAKRQERTDKTPVSGPVLKDPTDPNVKELRDACDASIQTTVSSILHAGLKVPEASLKGRIKPGGAAPAA